MVRVRRYLPGLMIACTACGGGSPPAEQAPAPVARREADVSFMHDMIQHHRQALTMAALIAGRSSAEPMRLLGQRITVSQQDEIARMRGWLARHGLAAPDSGQDHAHHGAGAAPMPGMLTSAQLAQLEAARGADFDRLFLFYMIQHHRGAITMVQRLLASPGAERDPEVFQLASDINGDQSAEIDRMVRLLASLPQERNP